MFLKALEIYEAVYGKFHAGTAQTLNCIAGVRQEMGAYAAAAEIYGDVLDIRKRVLGPEHPETASTMNDQAALLLLQHEYEEAEELYQEAMQIRLRVLGANHPDYAQSLNNLATLMRQVNRLDEARELFQQASVTCAAAFGANHPEVAQALRGEASVLQLQGKYVVVIILLNILHSSLTSLALRLHSLLSSAPLYNRALQIYVEFHGEMHPDVAVVLNDLGTLHAAAHNWKSAAENLERALVIHRAILASGINPEAALIMRNLGTVYEELLQSEKAKEWYRQSAEVFDTLFGASNADALKSRNLCNSI